MGQRHQIFLHVPNPVKNIPNWVWVENKELKAKLIKQLGKRKTCIVAFHNQWLYGRRALAMLIQALTFAEQFPHKAKLGSEDFGYYRTPITPNGIESNYNDFDKWIAALATILNFRLLNQGFDDAGFDGSFYLGDEEPEMNFNFTLGDNNDGITIIDMINNKYCFMNIFPNNGKDKHRHNNVCDLPPLEPLTAHQYVAAYYGETIKTCNTYHIERGKRQQKTPQQVVDEHKEENAKQVQLLEKFEVLTMEEVEKLFPRMYPKKKKKPKVKQLA